MRGAVVALAAGLTVALAGCGSGLGGSSTAGPGQRSVQATATASSSSAAPSSPSKQSSAPRGSSRPATSVPPSLSPAAPAGAPRGVPADVQPARVERVVDGDTVVLRAAAPGEVLSSAEQVTARLLEVDTPETVKPNSPVECFGPQASAFTKQLLAPGSSVWVAPDRERRDRFGRYLLYVWTANGRFANEELVRTGHARAVLFRPNDRYITRMRAAEADARAARRGLWGACGGQETSPAPGDRGSGTSLDPSRPKPTPAPMKQASGERGGATYYENCAAARAAGAAPIEEGQPGYGRHLDRDGDGTACDS